MEKFKFGRKLTEAVLSYENGQLYVVVEGEKRRAETLCRYGETVLERRELPV